MTKCVLPKLGFYKSGTGFNNMWFSERNLSGEIEGWRMRQEKELNKGMASSYLFVIPYRALGYKWQTNHMLVCLETLQVCVTKLLSVFTFSKTLDLSVTNLNLYMRHFTLCYFWTLISFVRETRLHIYGHPKNQPINELKCWHFLPKKKKKKSCVEIFTVYLTWMFDRF